MSTAGQPDRPPFTFARPQTRPGVRLINWVGARTQPLGWGPPALATGRILDEARRRSGLRDWGDDHFLDPLERLVDAFEREAELTTFGRLFVRGILTGCVENRLRLRAYIQAHPDALAQDLAPAVIVVGMPRTGTTLLYNLLAQDAEARPLLGWESLAPVSLEALRGKADRRQRNGRWTERGIDWIAPALQQIHPFRTDGPEECTWLMTNTLVSPVFSMLGRIPSYQQWLWDIGADTWHQAYRDYREQLLVLQHQRGGGHWVLKSPVHFMSLEPLIETLPEARVVFADRDPREVVPSACSLFAVFRAIGAERIDPVALGDEICVNLSRGLRRMEMARARRPERVLRVAFRDLVADKVGTVRGIHRRFGLPFSPETERRVTDWIANDRHAATHRYGLEQFGISEAILRQQFSTADG
jgi:hypothetical protein